MGKDKPNDYGMNEGDFKSLDEVSKISRDRFIEAENKEILTDHKQEKMRITLEQLFIITKKNFPIKRYNIEKRELVADERYIKCDSPVVFFVRYCVKLGYSYRVLAVFFGVEEYWVKTMFEKYSHQAYPELRIKDRLLDNAVNIWNMEKSIGI